MNKELAKDFKITVERQFINFVGMKQLVSGSIDDNSNEARLLANMVCGSFEELVLMAQKYPFAFDQPLLEILKPMFELLSSATPDPNIYFSTLHRAYSWLCDRKVENGTGKVISL